MVFCVSIFVLGIGAFKMFVPFRGEILAVGHLGSGVGVKTSLVTDTENETALMAPTTP